MVARADGGVKIRVWKRDLVDRVWTEWTKWTQWTKSRAGFGSNAAKACHSILLAPSPKTAD